MEYLSDNLCLLLSSLQDSLPDRSQPSRQDSSSSCGSPRSKNAAQNSENGTAQKSPQHSTSKPKPNTRSPSLPRASRNKSWGNTRLESEKKPGSPNLLLRITFNALNYLAIWIGFLIAELAGWLTKGHCHITHFSDGTYYIDCVCYQPGYRGKC